VTKATLDKRFAILEARIGELQKEIRAVRSAREKNWQRAVAKYSQDDDLQAVFLEAIKLREADRKSVRGIRRKHERKE
jgi:hypothetical protein